MGRNTKLLQEIVSVTRQELMLDRLEAHFHNRFIVDAGSTDTVGIFADQLRLSISQKERSTVLDYIADQKMVGVNIDIVETAINDLLGWDRFVEP